MNRAGVRAQRWLCAGSHQQGDPDSLASQGRCPGGGGAGLGLAEPGTWGKGETVLHEE